MTDALVTIIIPVYNSEKYIEECVYSFLNQTYHNLEICLINDGSTDRSLELLHCFQQRDPERIKVYTQENQGVAATRNRGILCATGKYIMFADNDDYAEKDYVAHMVSEIEKTGADMVVGSCRKVDENGRIIFEQILTDDPWSKFRMITPWGRIIRKDFILEHQLVFGNYKVGEDSFFSVTAYNESDHVVTSPFIGYNWVQHESSVSNTVQKRAVTSPIPFLEALCDRNSVCKNISREHFEYFVIKYIVWNLYYVCDTVSKKDLKHITKSYFEWMNQQRFDFKRVSIRKPAGESLAIRLLIWILLKLPFHTKYACLRAIAVLKRIAKPGK